MIVAGLLGWLVFSRRIRGPYFALLTQATALIFWLLLVGQLQLTAGTNGLTNFTTVFGKSRYDPETNTFLYMLAASACSPPCCWAARSCAAGSAGCSWPPATARTACASSATTPPASRRWASSSPPAWPGLAGALAAPILGIVAPNQFAVVPVDPHDHLGRHRRPGHALRRHPRRPAGGPGRDELQREPARRLAVPAGDPVRRRHRLRPRRPARPAEGRARPGVAAGQGPGGRRGPARGAAGGRRGRARHAGGPRRRCDDRERHADPAGQRPVRRVRRVQGADRRRPGRRAGRAAVPHRPQRRRQDHADRRRHRADPGRRAAR